MELFCFQSGSRPYTCNYCPKDFTNFPNWLKHTRRRHKVDHKTGEKLMVMPNFLSKEKKSNGSGGTGDGNDSVKKKERTKKPRKATKDQTGSGTTNSDNNQFNNLIKTEQPAELEVIESPPQMSSIQMQALIDDSNAVQVSPSASTNSTDLSTITVNDRILPLNTSDDLERAASLLMQQTLDLEDEMEYINIKSEAIDTSLYQNHYGHDGREKYFFIDTNKDLDCQIDHLLNNQYEIPHHPAPTAQSIVDNSDFLYSYYPQTTQCDLMTIMKPLPPITTIERKFKAIVTN